MGEVFTYQSQKTAQADNQQKQRLEENLQSFPSWHHLLLCNDCRRLIDSNLICEGRQCRVSLFVGQFLPQARHIDASVYNTQRSIAAWTSRYPQSESENESPRLKKLLAEAILDNAILEDVAAEK
ncbi:hypothetical protein [Agrobacterium sp. fls2-241-TYG-188a]|uniref:hypothetical protein n=1 Tax=Agrobacterium sp. fls2-241-TYG-188a TaxID=3040275 RepID=UPI000DE015DE|nr:hypothetical protein [Agrobacterium sp. fls2-241-TYG-188a]